MDEGAGPYASGQNLPAQGAREIMARIQAARPVHMVYLVENHQVVLVHQTFCSHGPRHQLRCRRILGRSAREAAEDLRSMHRRLNRLAKGAGADYEDGAGVRGGDHRLMGGVGLQRQAVRAVCLY